MATSFTPDELHSIATMTTHGAPISDGGDLTLADLLQIGGTFNGDFAVTAVTVGTPDPAVGFVTLWDVYAAGGPYHYSLFEPPDGINEYHARLLGNVSIVKAFPDIFNGIQGKRQATVDLSNLPINPEAPTLSELMAAENILGLFAPVRLYDLTTQTDLFRLNGKITGPTPGLRTARAVISIDEPKSLDQQFPKLRTATLFPDLDLTTTKIQDPVVLVPFGPAKKNPLVQIETDNLTYWDYGAIDSDGVTVANVYREGALVDPLEYTIVEPTGGILRVRFSLDQRDRGRPLEIKVDLTTTRFQQNPAQVTQFILENATYGCGETVNADAFTLAATNFSAIPLRVGGCVTQQQSVKSVLGFLLLHGAYLDRNDDGEYIEIVDTLDKHPQHLDPDMQLGFGLEDWHNVSNEPDGSIRDETQRLNELIVQGAFDPYFDNRGSWYIRTTRTRDEGGVSKTIQNPYLVDASSTDRQCHYLWYRNNARDAQYPVDATSETYVLDLGHLVKTTVPTLQLNQTVMEIISRGFKGGKELPFSYIIAGWDPQAFAYLVGDIEASPFAEILTDYRRTPPATPTNFAAVGFTRAGEGKITESFVTVTADAPAVNVTHLAFNITRAGSDALFPEVRVPCVPGEVGVTAEFRLDAGGVYDLRCYAVNTNNDPDRQESQRVTIIDFLAPGDSLNPAPPTNFYVTRGTGRNAYARWTASVDAPKIRTYEIQWDTDPSFGDPTISEEKTTRTTLSDLPYDAEIYFRIRAVSRAGLFSIWSHSQVMKIVRLLASDYGQDTVYRYHRAPLNQVVFIVHVDPHTSFSFTTGIDAEKFEWQAGMLGVQATDEWDSISYDGDGLPLGTRLFVFQAGGGFAGPFNTEFDVGIWNGTADDLDTVVRAMGS